MRGIARSERGLDRFDQLKRGLPRQFDRNPLESGITISAGRFLGFNRDTAARVSFLMSLPIIAGAVAYKGLKLAKDGIPHGLAGPMLVGVITSAVAGWLAVWGTLKWVRTRSFAPFVVYRVALGVAVLVIVAAGWRSGQL